MSIVKRIIPVVLTATMAICASVAHAQTTVEAIKKRGKIIVGVQGDNPPWGFVNAKSEYEGFDPDVASLLARDIGVQVEFVPLAIANRIPTLVTGKVDVLFATLNMLPQRAKSIQFTEPYAALDIGLVAPKAAKIAAPADLKGMSIGVPRGSTMDAAVTRTSPKDANILRFDDDSTAQQALISGQIQAAGAHQFWMPRLNERAPGAFEMKFTYETFYNGAGTRLGEKEWNAYINSFIKKIKANGELAAVYKKWMQREPHKFPEKIEGVPYSVE